MIYNTELQSNNEDLQEILRQVNELPDEGSVSTDAVLYVEQDLTEDQKAQARENIGAEASGAASQALQEAKEYTGEMIDEISEGFSKVIYDMYGDDITGESAPTIRQIANDEANTVINDASYPAMIAEVINVKEKYSLDDTGVTDCSALITQAIADANAKDTLFLPNGTYRLDSTVVVNKAVNLMFEGKIKYTGADFAFQFQNYNYAKAKFNIVESQNGSCLKLFSNWSDKHFIQYSQFSFMKLESRKKTDGDAGGCCIYIDSSAGWVNENRFTGGQMIGGYGVYSDCQGNNTCNGNVFDSCGVEDIGIGFYLANNCRDNMIFKCRHSESFDKFIVTVGTCFGLKVISNSPFYIDDNDISTGTSGFVIATLTNEQGSFCGTKGNFVRGTLVSETHDYSKNLYSEPAGVFDMTTLVDYNHEYTNFLVDGPCSGIKLSRKYGAQGGINEFLVKFDDVKSDFQIVDYTGSALSYTAPQTIGSVIKFVWDVDSGWNSSFVFTDAEQVKSLIKLSDYVRNGEAVMTVNNMSPDENGNVNIDVKIEEAEVVGSLAECTDTSKRYVLPDGYIYAYRKKFIPGGTYPNFTNQLPISLDRDLVSIYNDIGYKYDVTLDYKTGEEYNPELPWADFLTGFIPVKLGDTVRINQICAHEGMNFIYLFNSQGKYITRFQMPVLCTQMDNNGGSYIKGEKDSNELAIYTDIQFTPSEGMNWWYTQDLAYLVFYAMPKVNPKDIIITVNEEITYTVIEDRYEWGWENTGEPYVKPDYIGMINDLETRVMSEFDSLNNKKTTFFKKPFVALSFDNFNLTDDRFDIVHGEYGYKATIAHKRKADIEINKKVLSAGWDIGLYNPYNCPKDQFDDAISETPSAETLKAWDDYVKASVDDSAEAMVYNPTAWLATQGVSCYGLEVALKKYGIPMCRGAYRPTYSNDFRYFADKLPTMTVAVSESLMPSTLEACKTHITNAVENGTGIAFLTHGIYTTDTEANANYGITEACLRDFLDTVKTYVDAGQLEVVTYRDIYAMYYPEEAKERDYNRIIKMMTGYNL